MIRIGVVDNHAIVRHSLQKFFTEHVDTRVVAQGSCADDAVTIAWRDNVDVLLLEIGMPGRSGIEAAGDVRRLSPETRMLVYSALEDDLYGAPLIRLGVRGFLNKRSSLDDLLKAVRTVALGGRWVSPHVAMCLDEDRRHSAPGKGHDALSAREMELFLALSKGTRLNRAALQMGISVKTASTYRTRILKKLNLATNTAMTRYAMAHGLLI